MENLASKLEAIADDAAKIVGSHGSRQSRQKIMENETRMTLFKHNNSALQPHTPRSSQTPRVEAKKDTCVFALSLHIPTEQGDFCLLSDEGPLSFRTGPDTIVFTLGEQLQEWSCGEFKGATGEINIEPEIQDDHEQGAYSVELKCSPSILNHVVDRINTISITDQIFAVLVLLLLLSLLSFLIF
ncbi:hypothetical protein L1987_60482 [Smallanthus sonchifolius]|uniref:Uncharacterized protein n=1 Tax=Smallanthus sonchifolius TaxID=185202 RepID=A0ACB9D8E1_9ASTR|nr:hypothetical protein L1987_60482 [Smallanthus sonchifolius]